MIRLIIIMVISLICNNLFSQFHAVYIPHEKLTRMKIDGKDTDWDWVSESYILTSKQMYNSHPGAAENMKDQTGWDCRIIMGWNDISNRIYLLVKIIDDVFIPYNSENKLNDGFQFVVNANNNGAAFYGSDSYLVSKNHIIRGEFVYDPVEKLAPFIMYGPNWFSENLKKCFAWGVTTFKDNSGQFVTIYEISMILMEKWSENSWEESIHSELIPDKKVRFIVSINDYDGQKEKNGSWSIASSGRKWYNTASDLPIFNLDYPLIESLSIYSINSILNIE